jgi:hypothetical protein
MQYLVIKIPNLLAGVDSMTTYLSLSCGIYIFQKYLINHNWRTINYASGAFCLKVFEEESVLLVLYMVYTTPNKQTNKETKQTKQNQTKQKHTAPRDLHLHPGPPMAPALLQRGGAAQRVVHNLYQPGPELCGGAVAGEKWESGVGGVGLGIEREERRI